MASYVNDDPDWNCGNNITAWKIALPCLYFIIFPPALLLNLVVAWICLHLKSDSTFMVYLKHLVAADLLMTLTLPIRGASKLSNASDWLNAFTCQFSSPVFYLAMNMCVILMGLISLDRYLKIVRSGGTLLCKNLLFSNVLSFTFWIALIGTNTIPIIITSNQDHTNKTGEFCMNMKSELGITWHTGVVYMGETIFLISCILIVFCYICIAKTVLESYQRAPSNSGNMRKSNVKLRVFLILIVFFICYVPYYCVRIPYTIIQVKRNSTCSKLKIAEDFLLWISALNVCLNPLIYFFLCKAFRQMFWKTFNFKRLFPSFGKKQ
ncbi:P2Y purinoceptor 14-like [Clarias gariepinus]|uniref:P2Y purinoceptor 14-like n=1 Tax=Clarias gariepinus TaxID=13013 RepID=UPI00234C4AF5|nr:P2Y purinoceptor 14-like [Clarias gariepinus]